MVVFNAWFGKTLKGSSMFKNENKIFGVILWIFKRQQQNSSKHGEIFQSMIEKWKEKKTM